MLSSEVLALKGRQQPVKTPAPSMRPPDAFWTFDLDSTSVSSRQRERVRDLVCDSDVDPRLWSEMVIYRPSTKSPAFSSGSKSTSMGIMLGASPPSLGTCLIEIFKRRYRETGIIVYYLVWPKLIHLFSTIRCVITYIARERNRDSYQLFDPLNCTVHTTIQQYMV
jgi:hypothetical protein